MVTPSAMMKTGAPAGASWLQVTPLSYSLLPQVSICRDDHIGSALDTADSSWDVEGLGGSQAHRESGNGHGGEMHVGR